MSQLFIRLYLDEDVSSLVAKLLRSRGFEVRTTAEAGQLGRSDAEQLSYAAENKLTLVTHNRIHFEQLAADYFASSRKHAGVIIAVRRRDPELTRRLLKILNYVAADEIEDQVLYI